jgi:50S ribosomal subunit-associated GTPase HflX
MGTLRTATFTITIRDSSDDELEAAAAAFTSTLHRAGMTPADALVAWQRMDEWERQNFAAEADPGAQWWRTMAIARDAVLAALRAAGLDGQRRPFMIEAAAPPH